MLYALIPIVLLLTAYVFFRYYYKPKREIARYVAILKNLGYTVYVMPFAFLGVSFLIDWDRGIALHKDSQYYERTVYSQIDVSIGNTLDRVSIVFVKPDLIKEFLSLNNIYNYPKYDKLAEGIILTIGVGIVFSEGQLWKNKRKLLSKVFNFDFVKDITPKIGEICDRCYNDFDKTHKIGQNKFKYDPVNVSSKMFNGVMMKCFFGSDLVEEEINGEKFEQFVLQTSTLSAEVSFSSIMMVLGKLAWNLGMTSQIRQLKRKVRLLRDKSKEVLKRRTEEVMRSPRQERHSDIIEALVYEKLDNKLQFNYSDEDLISQFQTFLVAGTDTTSRFYSMIVYYLGKYPRIQEKLRKEIDSVIKQDKDITYENIKKLTYLEWIQQETSRYFGPANSVFDRVALKDNTIVDIPIKAGTLISYQSRGNHFNPKYFKDPDEFRPERWESECDGIDPYAFLGFSAGPRSCLGKHLAYLESKIAIIKLLRRYKEIEVPEEVILGYGLVYEAQKFDVVYTKV